MRIMLVLAQFKEKRKLLEFYKLQIFFPILSL